MDRLLKQILLCLSVLMIMVSAVLPGMQVYADNGSNTAIEDVSDPGILPDSAFYFLKGWGRNLQLILAADNMEKARLQLKFTNEDALALKKLCDEGKYDAAAGNTGQYLGQLQSAIRSMEMLRAELGDNQTRELGDRLEQNYLRQQAVLASVLEKAPEAAQQGLLNAIENSNKHIESYILARKGQGQSNRIQTQAQTQDQTQTQQVQGQDNQVQTQTQNQAQIQQGQGQGLGQRAKNQSK